VNVKEAQILSEILKKYEEASGQAINLQKSEIFFSKNTNQAIREFVKNILHVTESIGYGKYLGLPSMVGRKKRAMFNHI
jgi:hypothetical protein